jgi:hypothetical protein
MPMRAVTALLYALATLHGLAVPAAVYLVRRGHPDYTRWSPATQALLCLAYAGAARSTQAIAAAQRGAQRP